MEDTTILTERRYYKPDVIIPYIQNILDEYEYLQKALINEVFTVARTFWDNQDYDWSATKPVVFRTI